MGNPVLTPEVTNMEENQSFLKNIHIVVRPSPLALKILLVVLIVLCITALTALRVVHNNIQSEIENLKSQAAAVEYHSGVLEERMQDLTSFENIKNIAKEELGLVDPNTIVIDPQ